MQVNRVRPLGSGVRAFARCAARLVDEARDVMERGADVDCI